MDILEMQFGVQCKSKKIFSEFNPFTVLVMAKIFNVTIFSLSYLKAEIIFFLFLLFSFL
jgi:hypothetical protein